MERTKLFVILFAFLIGAGVFFLFPYIKGILPAITPAPEDITKLIEESSVNDTGLPLTLPPGFSISIFAKNLGKPRVLAYDPIGNLLASIPEEGKVVALPDRDGDGKADQIQTVISGLNNPHGIAFRCTDTCKLYIAETNQVAAYDYDAKKLIASRKKKIVDLPSGGGHWTRTLLFMPFPNDHRLLVSVGSSCNVCNESDSRRAKILSLDIESGSLKTFASGLRNAVFMALHSVSGKIWVTEMGRDLLGDDLPSDEINIINEEKNYGWPICYGKNIHDDNFDPNIYIRNPCMEPFEIPSYIDIPAHSAPLGLAFIPEEGWPQEYWYDLLVAYHGSWNRTEPTGYKIVRYKLGKDGEYEGQEDFITGWLTPDGVLGRPVDILAHPGGVMYISDDKAGVVYRIVSQPYGSKHPLP